MLRLGNLATRILVIVFFWVLQFVIGYIAFGLLFGPDRIIAAAGDVRPNNRTGRLVDKHLQEKCEDCRLTGSSIDDLIRRPRQMDTYGQVDDRIDLAKIKKAVCKDYHSDAERQRCRDFYFTQLASVERWKQSGAKMSFFDFVCIKDLKLCCPEGSYGPRCTKCTNCKANERCDGEGTRLGNGSCICKDGHTGLDCSQCSAGYYRDQSNLAKCERCHKSCAQCRGPGPSMCEVCNAGYEWVAPYGCSDIDECIASKKKVCGTNTFCVNTDGSYFCYECDRACLGCHGDGPDMCLKCNEGYQLEKGNCVAKKKTILPPEANYYRYGIYFGLCICTCIILHNNMFIASMVGLAVALYIGFSEYLMSVHDSPNKAGPQLHLHG